MTRQARAVEERRQRGSGIAAFEIGAEERTRRFWRAHARSFVHLTLLHAFISNPRRSWTVHDLSNWYGIRLDRAKAVARELAACGILRSVDGRAEAYRLHPSLTWLDIEDPASQEIFVVARAIQEMAALYSNAHEPRVHFVPPGASDPRSLGGFAVRPKRPAD